MVLACGSFRQKTDNIGQKTDDPPSPYGLWRGKQRTRLRLMVSFNLHADTLPLQADDGQLLKKSRIDSLNL